MLEEAMDRRRVSSSNLRSVGYDEERSILEIEFLAGPVYQYFNVSYGIYRGLMNASSKGGYFDTYIRKRGYRYRIGSDDTPRMIKRSSQTIKMPDGTTATIGPVVPSPLSPATIVGHPPLLYDLFEDEGEE